MKSMCGADCENCGRGGNNGCKGCEESTCCPSGKQCFAYRYIKSAGIGDYASFKKMLIDEFNSLGVVGMTEISELYELSGAYVNLTYTMPNGEKSKLLDDNDIYLGTQVECEFSDGITVKCFGLATVWIFSLLPNTV